MAGGGRAVVRWVVLVGLVSGLLPFETPGLAALPSAVPTVEAEPPDGDDVDASDVPGLESAAPAALPDRPGVEAPAVECGDFPADVLDAANATAEVAELGRGCGGRFG